MIAVDIEEIPGFLKEGSFYRSMQERSEGKVEVPSRCFKATEDVGSIDELSQLLHTINFWEVDAFPAGLLDYCVQHEPSTWRDIFDEILNKVGQFEAMLKNTFQKGSDLPVVMAIQAGKVELMEDLVSLRQVIASQDLATIAAKCGSLACLKALHELRYPWDTLSALGAASGGHLDCLAFLHEQGCPWDQETPSAAALHGHINTLRFAIGHGCPYRAELVKQAVTSGSLACVRYLVEDLHLPMDESVFEAAFVRADVTLVQYLLEHGCPYKGYEFSGELLWHFPTPALMDSNFILCLDYAHDYEWSPNAALKQYIHSHADKLQLSHAYLAHME